MTESKGVRVYAALTPRDRMQRTLGRRCGYRKVQELLGHRHMTTTQIYDKRRRTTAESASHEAPI